MSISHLNALPKARTLRATVQGGPGAGTPRSFSCLKLARLEQKGTLRSILAGTLTPDLTHTFIARWSASGGSERANYALFLSELCDVLGVPRPDVATSAGHGHYVFEREIREVFTDGTNTSRFIDLYKQGSFVLEAKQGVEAQEAAENEARARTGQKPRKKRGHGVRGTKTWDISMVKAKEQAQSYVRFLPTEEGRPPFVLVVDVGHVVEVYSEFSRTGGNYLPFPNAVKHRIPLADLANEDIRTLLRTIWLDPLSLDPAKYAALVTREVAGKLAELGGSLEAPAQYSATQVSEFLMRMIFTMFAEDMNLLPKGKFLDALESLRGNLDGFQELIGELWEKMALGGYSAFLRAKVLHFNGGLFEDVEVLPVTAEQLELLIEAAKSDWSQVEPSIFGTLVERALDRTERHRLGAHYTPRAYVERLVNRVVMEPLRDDWRGVLVEVQHELSQGEGGTAEAQHKAREAAVKRIEEFLTELRKLKVLDPACGTGNFLYVSMELIKRLEAEAHEYLLGLGGQPQLLEVSPESFLGLELNPRAASVASLVLWIGYLQIYARSHKQHTPPEPILQAFKNIRTVDAVLDYKGTEPNPLASRWDGVSRIADPATGRMVPDPSARIQDSKYLTPTQRNWPIANFIVGNPPFIGAGPMRETLGDGYVKALRLTYKISKHHAGVPDSADFVMYWWFKAAQLLSLPKLRRFGFVTTNSIKQTFNRRVIESALSEPGRHLVYAVPDHPWVDEADGAAVRIAMTVMGRSQTEGVIERVVEETVGENGEYQVKTVEDRGQINADLTVGTDVTAAVELRANEHLSNPGVKLHGSGFIVTPEKANELGLGRIEGLENHIREYRNGRDLTSHPREVLVIDLFGLSEDYVRERFPEVYQHVKLTVKPERDQNNRAIRREKWWLFGETNPKLRHQLNGLARYIVTVETSKHRFFQFLGIEILPDNRLVVIADEDAYILGILSSYTHCTWALAQGGTLEDRPVYNKTRCFETFPFPNASVTQKQAIRQKAEALSDHRKARLALHPKLTMTGLYNVLEKLRTAAPLNDEERQTHDQGLVSTLRDLHEELDALVAAVYGWPTDLSAAEVLARLTALNGVRELEERQDIVKFLRPAYQDPDNVTQDGLLEAIDVAAATAKLPIFPKRLGDQSQAVRQLLRAAARPMTPQQVAKSFKGVRADRTEELLEMLVSLGQAREVVGQAGYTA